LTAIFAPRKFANQGKEVIAPMAKKAATKKPAKKSSKKTTKKK